MGKKQAKDPNAPKRPMTAFFHYSNEHRDRVRKAHPQYKIGDIAKELSRQWNGLKANEKQKYEALSASDKQRYENEKAAYEKKHGIVKKGKK